MEEKSKNGILLRMIQRLTDSQLAVHEYLFIIFATLLEIAMPFLCCFFAKKVGFPLIIAGVFGAIIFVFVIFHDVEEFYKANYVDYLYFQIIILILMVLCGVVLLIIAATQFKEEIKSLTEYLFRIEYHEALAIFVVCVMFILCVLLVACSISVYDLLFSLLMWIFAKANHLEIKNPYMEQLKAAGTKESREEYLRRKLREEYEKMAEESVYRQEPLFENTKYFKGITDLEQVRPRYLSLMKQYHPDNAEGTIEICQEIQEEYQTIEKKYNL